MPPKFIKLKILPCKRKFILKQKFVRDLEIPSKTHVRSVRRDNQESSQIKAVYYAVFQMHFAWPGPVIYINVACSTVCPAELCFTFLSIDFLSYSSSVFMFISVRHILH